MLLTISHNQEGWWTKSKAAITSNMKTQQNILML
jgi:hypothetical protein